MIFGCAMSARRSPASAARLLTASGELRPALGEAGETGRRPALWACLACVPEAEEVRQPAGTRRQEGCPRGRGPNTLRPRRVGEPRRAIPRSAEAVDARTTEPDLAARRPTACRRSASHRRGLAAPLAPMRATIVPGFTSSEVLPAPRKAVSGVEVVTRQHAAPTGSAGVGRRGRGGPGGAASGSARRVSR